MPFLCQPWRLGRMAGRRGAAQRKAEVKRTRKIQKIIAASTASGGTKSKGDPRI